MPTIRLLLILPVALVLALAGTHLTATPSAAGDCHSTGVTEWAESAGGNGHTYQGVCTSGATWDDAEATLEATGGHLATLTSAAENSFVFNLIDHTDLWSRQGDFCPGPFIGAFQTPGSPEPAGGWVWVTEEPFAFAAWAPDEPGDSDTANENRVSFGKGDCGPDISTAPVWHDIEADENGVRAYVAEWDAAPLTVEFTQGIQELQSLDDLRSDLTSGGTPPVPMIAEKAAVMRVYFGEVQDTRSFTLEVSGEVGGTEDVTVSPGCTVDQRRQQEPGCPSLDFYFTPPQGAWSVRLVVKDFADEIVLDEDLPFQSVTTNALNVEYLPVCVRLTVGAVPTCPSNFIDTTAPNLMRKLFPAADNGITYQPLAVPPFVYGAPISSDPEETALLAALRQQYELMASGANMPDQLAGWLPDGGASTGTLGISDPVWLGSTGRVTWQQDASSGDPLDTQHTLAHEIGHNLGLRHTNLVDGCGASDNSTGWPYNDSTIQEVGFDVVAGQAKPATKKDLMTYCTPPGDNIWISPFTYNALLQGNFQPLGTASTPAGSEAGQFLVVTGTAQADGSAATLGSSYVITSSVPAEPSNPAGNYCLRFTSVSQTDYCFTLEFESHRSHQPIDAESFTVRVPLPQGTTRIALMHGSDELDGLEASPAAPSLEIDEPLPGAVWSGEETIAWTGSDTDSGPLTYAVLYSPDGGDTWLPIAVDATDAELTFDTSTLDGEEVLVRVLASDGLNTTAETTSPIALAAPGTSHMWGDNDCDGEISSRDNQALSRKVLQQSPLSQTQPCPALGDAVAIAGASHMWGDLDCDGEISSRDNQALLRKVLQQNALSQTQPCPAVGDGVTTAAAALPGRRESGLGP